MKYRGLVSFLPFTVFSRMGLFYNPLDYPWESPGKNTGVDGVPLPSLGDLADPGILRLLH